jgi:hypothetical protein
MRTLNREVWRGLAAGGPEAGARASAPARVPVKVLQIGEGNFLRAFVDWMLHVSRSKGLFDGAVAVVQPRPSGREKIGQLAAQDGLCYGGDARPRGRPAGRAAGDRHGHRGGV